jgi:hypothetical protein
MTQKSTSTEDYLAKLRDRKGKNGAPAAPGQVNPPSVAVSAPAQPAAEAPKAVNKLAARLAAKSAAAAPPPAPEVVEDPPAEPAPTETEEAPKRPRGRPAAEQKPATPADMWSMYASKAMPPLIGALQQEEVVDAEMQEGVAQTAGAFADALLKEYLSRFGG